MYQTNPLSAIQFIAEKRIEDALEKGEMDNLPGRGRPLELEDMSHIPEELRMAYKILRNAACLPPEQEEGKEISRLTEMLDQCEDEQERVHQMQKLRFMTLRAQTRHQRHILIEQENCIIHGCWSVSTACQYRSASADIFSQRTRPFLRYLRKST